MLTLWRSHPWGHPGHRMTFSTKNLIFWGNFNQRIFTTLGHFCTALFTQRVRKVLLRYHTSKLISQRIQWTPNDLNCVYQLLRKCPKVVKIFWLKLYQKIRSIGEKVIRWPQGCDLQNVNIFHLRQSLLYRFEFQFRQDTVDHHERRQLHQHITVAWGNTRQGADFAIQVAPKTMPCSWICISRPSEITIYMSLWLLV